MRGFSVAEILLGMRQLLFGWWRLSWIWALRRLGRNALGLAGVRRYSWYLTGQPPSDSRSASAKVSRGTIKRHRTVQQAAAVGLRHVNEEPVVVVVLVVEHANAFRFARACDSEDRPTAERWSVKA